MKKPTRATKFQRELEKIVEWGNGTTHRQHPEDRKMQRESIAKAKKVGPAFVHEHRKLIAAAITVYADKAAEDLLELLREHFWSGDWERRRRQRRVLANPSTKAKGTER